jgi:beta-aspartyl-peptidase (threonine type)
MSRPNLPAALCLLCLSVPLGAAGAAPADDSRPIVLVIHGGAGVIERARMTAAKEASYRSGLGAALDAGFAILERGGTSLDAVTAAVRAMEDDPQFNAGRGAVLNHHGDAELDAAIMDGSGPRAGAVAALLHVKNPIELARLVMERSPHVLLVAGGAEEFAREQGVALVPRGYFRTEARERELEEARRSEQARARGAPTGRNAASGSSRAGEQPGSMGTVGAVALDRAGNLAAATSTGGLTNKHRGRVGDSPIIGAGTYANNESCAVSGTGQGEYFIRQVVAYDICALVQYRHLALAEAVHTVIHEKLRRSGGEGGAIAVDPAGNIAMDFNSVGMFRGVRDSRGRREIAMYRDVEASSKEP